MVFFGSSPYSIPILNAILKSGLRPLVVTVPDRPQGRGLKMKPNQLAQLAAKQHLDIIKPASLKKEKLSPTELSSISRHRLGICAVYGKIVPQWLLDQLPKGILNLHPSLLPKYRGASPALGMMLNNESKGGFSIIKMDAKLDHGPLLYQENWPLPAQQTAGEYYQFAFRQMAAKIVAAIEKYRQGELPSQPQNHAQASFTPLLKRQDGYLPPAFFQAALAGQSVALSQLPPITQKLLPKHPSYPAAAVAFNLYRGLSPWPGIWTEISRRGQTTRLKILSAQLSHNRFLPTKVQLAGGRLIDWKTL